MAAAERERCSGAGRGGRAVAGLGERVGRIRRSNRSHRPGVGGLPARGSSRARSLRHGRAQGPALQGRPPGGEVPAGPRVVADAQPRLGLRAGAMVMTTPIAVFPYRTRAIATANVPADGPVILAPNHFSNMDHFFAGGLPAAEDQVHGQVAALLPQPGPRLHLPVRRRLPGPPRPPRRGGVHHRARDPRRRRLRAHLLRGRAVADRQARRGEAGRRPARARVRACRSSRSRSTARRACARGSGSSSRRSRSSTASRSTFERVAEPDREQQLEAAQQIFDRVKEMYAALERAGPQRRDQARCAAGAADAQPRRRSPGPVASSASLVTLLRPSSSARGRVPGGSPPAGRSGEELQLAHRAPPVVAVERSRRLGRVVELAERVDRVAGDHQVAVGQPADHRLVPGAVAGVEASRTLPSPNRSKVRPKFA